MDAVVFPYAIIQKTDAQNAASRCGASAAIRNVSTRPLAIHGYRSAQNVAQIWSSEKEVTDRFGDV